MANRWSKSQSAHGCHLSALASQSPARVGGGRRRLGPGTAPSLPTHPSGSCQEGLEGQQGKAGPQGSLGLPCLSLSFHKYKLPSRATGPFEETGLVTGGCPKGLLSLLSTRLQPQALPRASWQVSGPSSPGYRTARSTGAPSVPRGCSPDLPACRGTNPCPAALHPALEHLAFTSKTSQTSQTQLRGKMS